MLRLRRLDVKASRFVRYVGNLALHLRRHDAADSDAPIRVCLDAEAIQKSNRLRDNRKWVGGPRLEEPIVTALTEKGEHEPREIKIVEQRGTVQDRPLERVLTAFQRNNANAKVIILGEKDLQYHLLEQVLISCANAKITNVNFQTKPAGSGSVVAQK